MHMSTNEEPNIEIAKYVCMWLCNCVTVYTEQHKILMMEYINQFDKFPAVCQYIPYQNFQISSSKDKLVVIELHPK